MNAPQGATSPRKLHIADLFRGNFFKEGNKSFVKLKDGSQVGKIQVLSTIVDKYTADDGNYAVLSLDDSTETIRAKLFKEDVRKVEKLGIGDIVDIVGFSREYEKELYIAPQTIHKIKDPNWELLRKLEILGEKLGFGKKPDLEPLLLDKLKELDSGEGVNLDSLIAGMTENYKNITENEIMDTLRVLMMRGEVYEPKSKVLKRID